MTSSNMTAGFCPNKYSYGIKKTLVISVSAISAKMHIGRPLEIIPSTTKQN